MNEKIYNLISNLEMQGKENAHHLQVLNEDSVKLADEQKKIKEELATWREHNAVKLANIENDLIWLKKFFWIIATASVGGLITGVIQLLVK